MWLPPPHKKIATHTCVSPFPCPPHHTRTDPHTPIHMHIHTLSNRVNNMDLLVWPRIHNSPLKIASGHVTHFPLSSCSQTLCGALGQKAHIFGEPLANRNDIWMKLITIVPRLWGEGHKRDWGGYPIGQAFQTPTRCRGYRGSERNSISLLCSGEPRCTGQYYCVREEPVLLKTAQKSQFPIDSSFRAAREKRGVPDDNDLADNVPPWHSRRRCDLFSATGEAVANKIK